MQTPYLIIFMSTTILLAWIDTISYRLPNILTYSLTLIGLIANIHASFISFTHALFSCLACFIYLSLIASIYKITRHKTGLGGGDIKLLVAFSAWFGFYQVMQCIILASLSALVFRFFYALIKGKNTFARRFAFGPYLIAAMLFILAMKNLAQP